MSIYSTLATITARWACLAASGALLAGCIMSEEPLITAQDADYPFAPGTLIEKYDVSNVEGRLQFSRTEEPRMTLTLEDGYYTPNGKDKVRLKKVYGYPYYLMMSAASNNGDRFTYTILYQADEFLILYQSTSDQYKKFKDFLKNKNPSAWAAYSRGLRESENGSVVFAASLDDASSIVLDMVLEGFSSPTLAYKIVGDKPEQQLGSAESANHGSNFSEEQLEPDRVTERLTNAVLRSKWASQKEGFKSLRVEFFSKAIFGFSVKPDKSECHFHFWRNDHSDKMLNRAFDRACDGTVEAVMTFEKGSEWKFRPMTAFEQAFYGHYLPRYAAVFEAVNAYKAYNPTAQLSLIPDVRAIAENRELLGQIATAATGSGLMGVRRGEEPYPQSDPVFKIWVNSGVDDGGFVLYFSAERQIGEQLKDCFVSTEDPDGEENFLDKNCDAIPEFWSDARGSRKVAVAGNEQVVKSILLDVARFAEVANDYFHSGEPGELERAAAELAASSYREGAPRSKEAR